MSTNATPRNTALRNLGMWTIPQILNEHEQLERELNEAKECIEALMLYHPMRTYPTAVLEKEFINGSNHETAAIILKARAILKS